MQVQRKTKRLVIHEWCCMVKWLSPYARRLLRRLIHENKEFHKGYRYIVVFDEESHLIIMLDKKTGKKHVFLKGR